jgi:hypothetical protein
MKEIELPSREIGIMKEMKEMPSVVQGWRGNEIRGKEGGLANYLTAHHCIENLISSRTGGE